MTKLYRFAKNSQRRLNKEQAGVLHKTTSVHTDCAWFAREQSKIQSILHDHYLDAVQRYLDTIYTNLYHEVLETKNILQDALETFIAEALSLEDQYILIQRLNETIWSKLAGIPYKLLVLENESFDNIIVTMSGKVVSEEYRLQSDLVEPLLVLSRVDCSWCLTSTSPVLTDCIYCDTFDIPFGQIITNRITVYMTKTLEPLLYMARMDMDNLTHYITNETNTISQELFHGICRLFTFLYCI